MKCTFQQAGRWSKQTPSGIINREQRNKQQRKEIRDEPRDCEHETRCLVPPTQPTGGEREQQTASDLQVGNRNALQIYKVASAYRHQPLP